jgi:hypothetical protein
MYGREEAVALNRTTALSPESLRDMYTQTLPHEMNHASQDRFGLLSSIFGSQQKKWAGRPHEWEAIYAGKIGDPAKSKLRVPDILAQGQRLASEYPEHLQPSSEDLQQVLVSLNRRFAKQKAGLMDLAKPASGDGPRFAKTVDSWEDMDDPAIKLITKLMAQAGH